MMSGDDRLIKDDATIRIICMKSIDIEYTCISNKIKHAEENLNVK